MSLRLGPSRSLKTLSQRLERAIHLPHLQEAPKAFSIFTNTSTVQGLNYPSNDRSRRTVPHYGPLLSSQAPHTRIRAQEVSQSYFGNGWNQDLTHIAFRSLIYGLGSWLVITRQPYSTSSNASENNGSGQITGATIEYALSVERG